MKYNIDPELELISKIKMPNNPKLLPLMNAVCRGFSCKSDDKVTVNRYGMPGYLGASLVVHVIEPKQVQDSVKPLPCLVFFHGGGFMLRASGGHYKLAKEYAYKLPCKVIYVDYRLAPKHPFPVPVEDCFATYSWTLFHAERLGIDKNNIFLGGDSAGGNLAAAVALMARDRKYPEPKGVLLVYPVTDRRMNTASMQNFTDTPVWDAKLNRTMWQCYLGEEEPQPAEYASPAEAKDVSKFPPTYVEVAEFDCLHDEGVAFSEKLKRAGVATELHEIKGGCHGYETATGSLLVQACMDMRIAWMRKRMKENNHGLYRRIKKAHRASANSYAGRMRHGFKRKEATVVTKKSGQRMLGVSRWSSRTW